MAPLVPPSSQPPPFSEMKLKTQEPFQMFPSPSLSYSVHLSLIFPTISYTHCFPSGDTIICHYSCAAAFLQLFFSLPQMLLLKWSPGSASFLSFEFPTTVLDGSLHVFHSTCAPPPASPVPASSVHFNKQNTCLQFSISVHDDCICGCLCDQGGSIDDIHLGSGHAHFNF